MATVVACAGFAAICGSNTATAATMSSVALPEMRKYKYHPLLSTGSVAVGSTLGVVIPPSVVFIIIGLQTGQSIGKLFWSGVLPGVLLSVLFLATISLMCRLHPEWGPAGTRATFAEKIRALPGSFEMLALFGLVMGGLFTGLFTPTEAGAAMALLLGLALGNMSLKKFLVSVTDTLRISCMIMVIIAGAVVFGRFLAVTRLPFEAAGFVTGLNAPSWLVVVFVLAIYTIGGMVMDALALLLVTIPIFFPVAEAMGFDPIWFGALICVVTTMGAVTPPVGVNAYIVASLAPEVPMSQVFVGVSWFLPAYAFCCALMMLFPKLFLFLPNLM